MACVAYLLSFCVNHMRKGVKAIALRYCLTCRNPQTKPEIGTRSIITGRMFEGDIEMASSSMPENKYAALQAMVEKAQKPKAPFVVTQVIVAGIPPEMRAYSETANTSYNLGQTVYPAPELIDATTVAGISPIDAKDHRLRRHRELARTTIFFNNGAEPMHIKEVAGVADELRREALNKFHAETAAHPAVAGTEAGLQQAAAALDFY